MVDMHPLMEAQNRAQVGMLFFDRGETRYCCNLLDERNLFF
jgi:hypothetical protein